MGTRGFITFVADEAEKTSYNHFDSYPSGLGLDVLRWLRFAVAEPTESMRGVLELKDKIRELRVVDGEATPTPEDVERLAGWTNLNVSTQKTDDWYCLLRETQGKPGAMIQAGYVLDASDFPCDSLMAEYGYVIDLDAANFEVYQGFQKSRPTAGRFKDRDPDPSSGGYFPVALWHSWSLDKLPSDEEFMAALGEDDE